MSHFKSSESRALTSTRIVDNLKILSIVALALIALTSQVTADCGVCSQTTYAACINTTAFAVCYDGLTPSTQIVSCPDGQICTVEKGICKMDGSFIPGCSLRSAKCNECSNLFACVSKTEFSYCDNDAPGVIASCPPGYYCNTDKYILTGNICSPSCVFEPTCSNDVAVTPPPTRPIWKETCDSVTTAGYYKNIHDSSCKTYVYCEMYNNVMDSVLYNCTTGYFNQLTIKCEATKPAKCV